VVEGPVQVAEALAGNKPKSAPTGGPVERVFIDAEFDSTRAAHLTTLASEAGVMVHPVAPGVLRQILSTVNPQAVAAVVPQPPSGLDLLAAPIRAQRGHQGSPTGPVVVVVDLADPGNMGTLIRTAEASGADAVVAAGTCVDTLSPKVVRAAAGARLRLPVVVEPNLDAVLAAMVAAGRSVVATSVAPYAAPYYHHDLTTAAIVLGNEAHGLSSAIIDRADAVVTIPLAGPTESLNVATAGAVLCFEALRQREPIDERSTGQRP